MIFLHNWKSVNPLEWPYLKYLVIRCLSESSTIAFLFLLFIISIVAIPKITAMSGDIFMLYIL